MKNYHRKFVSFKNLFYLNVFLFKKYYLMCTFFFLLYCLSFYNLHVNANKNTRSINTKVEKYEEKREVREGEKENMNDNYFSIANETVNYSKKCEDKTEIYRQKTFFEIISLELIKNSQNNKNKRKFSSQKNQNTNKCLTQKNEKLANINRGLGKKNEAPKKHKKDHHGKKQDEKTKTQKTIEEMHIMDDAHLGRLTPIMFSTSKLPNDTSSLFLDAEKNARNIKNNFDPNDFSYSYLSSSVASPSFSTFDKNEEITKAKYALTMDEEFHKLISTREIIAPTYYNASVNTTLPFSSSSSVYAISALETNSSENFFDNEMGQNALIVPLDKHFVKTKSPQFIEKYAYDDDPSLEIYDSNNLDLIYENEKYETPIENLTSITTNKINLNYRFFDDEQQYEKSTEKLQKKESNNSDENVEFIDSAKIELKETNLIDSELDFIKTSEKNEYSEQQNELLLRKLKLPSPLIPPDGSGYAPEPKLPENAYPHEVRCPLGWVSTGPHCVTVISVRSYTTCPGDKTQFKKGVRFKMTVNDPGICAVNSVTGVLFDCPQGHYLQIDIIPQNYEYNHIKKKDKKDINNENHQLGRAIQCTGYHVIPYSLLNGSNCPLGYKPTIEGCKAEKQIPPTFICPPGFKLGGEAVSPYAFREKEYAKCGNTTLYRGKVLCPRGFIPFNVPYTELPFGAIIPQISEEKNENEEQPPLPRKLKNAYSFHNELFAKSYDNNNLPSTENNYYEDEYEEKKYIPPILEDFYKIQKINYMENFKHDEIEQKKIEDIDYDDEEIEYINYEDFLVYDVADEQKITNKDNNFLNFDDENEDEFFLDSLNNRVYNKKNEHNKKRIEEDEKSKQTIKTYDKKNHKESKLNFFPSPPISSMRSMFSLFSEIHYKRRLQIKKNEELHAGSSTYKRHLETKKKEKLHAGSSTYKRHLQTKKNEKGSSNFIVDYGQIDLLELNGMFPSSTSCIQLVAVFEANCSKYVCKSPYISSLQKIIKDWLFLQLESDPNEVEKIIPNGHDIRYTEKG